MTTDSIEGGYNDRQLLNRAIQHNRRCREILGRIIDNRLGTEGLKGLLLVLAYELGQQAIVLNDEWSRIRSPRRTHEEGKTLC